MNTKWLLRIGFGLLSLPILMLSVAQAPTPKFPAYITDKPLYAANDLRGKSAPKLVVKEWLSQASPDTTGKVILLDFWATWCPPCRETIPELNEWAKKFSKDLVVIGISDEASAAVKKFIETTPMNYSVGVDPSGTTSNKVGVKGIPHVLVITPDHIVRWQGFPLDDKDKLTTEKLAQIIAASKAKS